MNLKTYTQAGSTLRTVLLLVLPALLFYSCNKWLDVQPRSQVEDTELFSTESGYKEALAGVYSSMVSTKTYSKEMTYGFLGILGQEWDFYYDAQYKDAAAYNYEGSYPTATIVVGRSILVLRIVVEGCCGLQL